MDENKEKEEKNLDSFVGEIVDDVLPEREEKVDRDIRKIFIKMFGDNWASLPVKSPQGALALLLLDQVLSPQGITPRMLAESAISFADKLEFEENFNQFLATVKDKSLINADMVKELGGSVGGGMKQIIELLEAGAIVGSDLAAKTFKKGAQGFKKLLGNNDKNH